MSDLWKVLWLGEFLHFLPYQQKEMLSGTMYLVKQCCKALTLLKA